jgi:DNA polymerase III subunit epsilon
MQHMDVSGAVRILEAHPDYKVIRRLQLPVGPLVEEMPEKTWSAAIVDVEATGLDVTTDEVLELAIRRIRCDEQARVVEIGQPYSWLEQPTSPIDPKITEITGLTDADVEGRRIDTAAATRLLLSVDCVIAHNASYDRPMVERRLPDAAGKPWACSVREVNWQARGYDGRSLGFLLWQTGFFADAHRAIADVDALIALLRVERGSDRPILGELIDRASSPAWRVSARGAHIDLRHALKSRGYRWNRQPKVWEKELYGDERLAEEWWLARNVYTPEANPMATGPDWTKTDWWSRHAGNA